MSAAATWTASGPQAVPTPVPSADQDRAVARSTRRTWLAWAFTLLNSARVLSYLPTMWAIVQSGNSSQHSLWTWGTWLGANLTMAAWICESNGDRLNRAAMVCLANAAMCTTMIGVIVYYRM